jgi:hypothetical protein
MLTEVLTQYGPIYRLWFDHYGSPCGGGLTGCPGIPCIFHEIRFWIILFVRNEVDSQLTGIM